MILPVSMGPLSWASLSNASNPMNIRKKQDRTCPGTGAVAGDR